MSTYDATSPMSTLDSDDAVRTIVNRVVATTASIGAEADSERDGIGAGRVHESIEVDTLRRTTSRQLYGREPYDGRRLDAALQRRACQRRDDHDPPRARASRSIPVRTQPTQWRRACGDP